MGLKDWFTPSLEKAIKRGMKPDGNMHDELRSFSTKKYFIESNSEILVICQALSELMSRDISKQTDLNIQALADCLERVKGESAKTALIKNGLPLLFRLVEDAVLKRAEREKFVPFSVLYMLAKCGIREAADFVVGIVRKSWIPEKYSWHGILLQFDIGNPQTAYVFSKLSNPPPPNDIGMRLLDAANRLYLDGHDEIQHPFDNPTGVKQLEQWLIDPDENHYDRAYFAIVALPFLKSKERDSLLAIALDHPSEENQMEAAWAAGKLGRDAGIRLLAQYCTKLEHADKAQRYLRELGREDAILDTAREPNFAAKAEFCQWLAHPNELGRMPDEVEIVDQRELAWPPDGERKLLSLVRYRMIDPLGLKDDVGVGMVGSITFCLFTYDTDKRPPEDVYALHCLWEMEAQDLAKAESVDSPDEYRDMLARSPIAVTDADVKYVVELSPKLNYPQSVVAVAVGQKDGLPGHLVLDGPRTNWYPESEFPAKEDGPPPHLTLKIHVGRHLLGFHEEPDGKKWLERMSDRSPQQIVADFRAKLQAAMKDKKLAQQIVGERGKLNHGSVKEYLSKLVEVETEKSCSEHIVSLYDQIFELAKTIESDPKGRTFDIHSPIGSNFDHFEEAAKELPIRDKVKTYIEFLEPNWNHNWGNSRLAILAETVHLDEIAERIFARYMANDKHWYRGEAASHLAKLWKRHQREAEAKTLLLDVFNELKREHRELEYESDRKSNNEYFQAHRQIYLDLFPENGEAELKAHGIPKSLM
jgi:hypothetical protein